MQRKLTSVFLVLMAVMLIMLSSCGDEKSPMPGYLDEEELNQIVQSFDSTVVKTKYSYRGNLNYFDYEEDLVPRTIEKRNVDFVDSLDAYSVNCSSYYLRLPLHLTWSNWTSDQIDASTNLTLSTKYQMESRVYRPAGLDKVYYYAREDGGFILRAFGVNKNLIIKKPSDISCHAKWNLEIEYDANGFLVREYFATVNSSENNKSECCYGEATYAFS